MPTASGAKLRPALLIALLPEPYQTNLVCGISTRTDGLVDDWDMIIAEESEGFTDTGLRRTSAIRPSYLYSATEGEILGKIGSVPRDIGETLRNRIAAAIAAGGTAGRDGSR